MLKGKSQVPETKLPQTSDTCFGNPFAVRVLNACEIHVDHRAGNGAAAFS